MAPTASQRRTLAGFTLIETLLVLGAIAFLMVAAFVIYQKVNEQWKVDRAYKNILAAKALLDTNFPATRRNRKIETYSVIAGRSMPKDWYGGKDNPPYPINQWGGEIKISLQKKGYMADGSLFSLGFYGLPTSACINLTSLLVGSGTSFTLIEIASDTDRTTISHASTSNHPAFVADQSAINAACDSTGVILAMRWK